MQKQKTRLIVIAGPQSSGKSTLFQALKKRFPKNIFLEEINPYLLTGHKHFGAAFVDRNLQLCICNTDIQRTKKILSNHFPYDRSINSKTYIIETGIFGLAYLEKIIGVRKTNTYQKQYFVLYKKFNPVVIFIDTKPTISWKRRKEKYLNRLLNKGIKNKKSVNKMMMKYKKNLFDMYPLFIKYYQRIPFEKYMIKNSYHDKKTFEKQIMTLLQSIILRRH